MRSYKLLIREKQLLTSPPSDVYKWLVKRSKELDNREDSFNEDLLIDDELEFQLLNRNEPLITLGLAQHGISEKVLNQILSINENETRCTALTLALLSNKHMGGTLIYPLCESTYSLANASKNEIIAIFSNPSIYNKFLTDFFDQKEPWICLNEEQQILAIRSFASNPKKKKSFDISDYFSEIAHDSALTKAWNLAATVPVTNEWAEALNSLFYGLSQIPPFKNIEEVLCRWYPDVTDSKAIENENESNMRGYLSSFQTVRQYIIMAKHKYMTVPNDELWNSSDIAIRSAVYLKGRLSAGKIKEAFEKDKNIALENMLWNDTIWESEITRNALSDLCRESDLANNFYEMYEHFQKKYPRYFPDDYEIKNLNTMPTNKDIQYHIQEQAKAISEENMELKIQLKSISDKLNYIFGGVVALIVFLLLR